MIADHKEMVYRVLLTEAEQLLIELTKKLIGKVDVVDYVEMQQKVISWQDAKDNI